MLSSLKTLSWRFASGSGVRRQSRLTQAMLDKVTIGRPPREALPIADLSHGAQRRSAGDRILYLYFRQWLVADGVFLDLRPANFWWSDRELTFRPNGLWLKLRPEFQQGMVSLYRSFYADDKALLRQALTRMGMLRPGLDQVSEEQLLELLKTHFGMQAGAQRFSIDEFKRSFDRLFDFFIAHDYRLHSDFVFVGFYLITLYLNLETLGQKHDVRKICIAALGDGNHDAASESHAG